MTAFWIASAVFLVLLAVDVAVAPLIGGVVRHRDRQVPTVPATHRERDR